MPGHTLRYGACPQPARIERHSNPHIRAVSAPLPTRPRRSCPAHLMSKLIVVFGAPSLAAAVLRIFGVRTKWCNGWNQTLIGARFGITFHAAVASLAMPSAALSLSSPAPTIAIRSRRAVG
eukprot:scaffold28527_cov49-Phaeocystis_antarctica.AAC.1